MGTISLGTGISNGDGISLPMGGDYGIGYGDIVSLPGVITRYFIELNGSTSYYQLAAPISEAGDFSIPFEFYTADAVSVQVILGESAPGLNEIHISSGTIKVLIAGVEHLFTSAPAVADSKLHSGFVDRAATTVTLILDGVTYNEDVATPSTGNLTIDVYGQANSTEFFSGILADINGSPLGLSTGNVEGNVTYVNITDAQREEYQLNEAGTIWNNISITQLLPATIEIA